MTVLESTFVAKKRGGVPHKTGSDMGDDDEDEISHSYTAFGEHCHDSHV